MRARSLFLGFRPPIRRAGFSFGCSAGGGAPRVKRARLSSRIGGGRAVSSVADKSTPATRNRVNGRGVIGRRSNVAGDVTGLYASWRTFIGSIRVARRAGSQPATRPTATSTAVTAVNVRGSAGVTPKRMLSTMRFGGGRRPRRRRCRRKGRRSVAARPEPRGTTRAAWR